MRREGSIRATIAGAAHQGDIVTWTEHDIPDLRGRRAIVTGANAGLGLAMTEALAAAGAVVIMACRSLTRAEEARGRVRRRVPDGDIRVMELDLGSLDSVGDFASSLDGELDVLINNAGVMGGPRTTTVDGFESQMGINHLGHFALVGHLLPRMLQIPGSRVVTVSSLAALNDTLDVDDLDTTRSPEWMVAYAASKQANAVHAVELDRRLQAGRHETRALAAHPGLAATSLFDHMFPGSLRPIAKPLARLVGSIVFNSSREGARPLLRAATDPTAVGGTYYGPASFGQKRGPAVAVPLPPRAADPELGRDLWEASVALTGVTPHL